MKRQGRTKRVKCESGLTGWQCRLRKIYTDYLDFLVFSRMYGLHERLGYVSARAAWQANPVVQGSVNPSDFRAVSV